MPVAVVLCLPVREDDRGAFVLLGLKKTGFGRGRIVGPGGKIDPGESPEQAAARELEEETTLVVSPGDLEDAATIRFRMYCALSGTSSMSAFSTARTDVMAEGVIKAWEVLKPEVPVFFSIHGTGEDEAVALVRERLGIEPYDLMEDAVQAAVEAAQ